MNGKRWLWVVGISLSLLYSFSTNDSRSETNQPPLGRNGAKDVGTDDEASSLPTTEAEWRERLTREQYQVLRRKATEKAFSGKYWKTKEKGVYHCAGCGQTLFSSDTKFESGTGWPSFWQPADRENVANKLDRSHGVRRTEVLCSRCGGHLGHVFSDGPPPTGLRYCINSAALEFEPSPPASTKR